MPTLVVLHETVVSPSLSHWGQDKMVSIFLTTFSNAFSWMKMYISVMISLEFVLKGPINNIPTLVQIMALHHPGATNTGYLSVLHGVQRCIHNLKDTVLIWWKDTTPMSTLQQSVLVVLAWDADNKDSFQKEDHLSRYRVSYYKYKIDTLLSFGYSYTGKTASLYWNG